VAFRVPSPARLSTGLSLIAFCGLALGLAGSGFAPAAVEGPRVDIVKVRTHQHGRLRPPQPQTAKFRPADQEDRAREAALTRELMPAEPEPPPAAWSDAEIIDALRECVALLASPSVEVDVTGPVRQDRCGTAAPVRLHRVRSGGHTVEFRPAPQMNCRMVAQVHRWIETTVQPAARELLGSPVAQVIGSSSYACRNRNNAANGPISEHAFGNAIDVAGFVTVDGRKIEVVRDWGPTRRDALPATARANDPQAGSAPPEPAAAPGKRKVAELGGGAPRPEGSRLDTAPSGLGAKPAASAPGDKPSSGSGPTADTNDATTQAKPEGLEAKFLRRLHAGACGVFATVLGPEANDAHRDHFHFDMASRRRGSYCQ
jgi:hypothetical protein